jgi:hypothetical protein
MVDTKHILVVIVLMNALYVLYNVQHIQNQRQLEREVLANLRSEVRNEVNKTESYKSIIEIKEKELLEETSKIDAFKKAIENKEKELANTTTAYKKTIENKDKKLNLAAQKIKTLELQIYNLTFEEESESKTRTFIQLSRDIFSYFFSKINATILNRNVNAMTWFVVLTNRGQLFRNCKIFLLLKIKCNHLALPVKITSTLIDFAVTKMFAFLKQKKIFFFIMVTVPGLVPRKRIEKYLKKQD